MKTEKEYLKLFEEQIPDSLIELLMSYKAQNPEKQLLSLDQQKFACKETLKAEIFHFFESVKRGFNLLRSRLQNTYPKLQSELDMIDKEALEHLLLTNGYLPKIEEGLVGWQILGISRESMERLRSEAVEIYAQHHLDDATDAFSCLIALNHWDPRCWTGYGLSQQFSSKHDLQRAMDAYFIAIELDATNPYPYLYFAEGLGELGDPNGAIAYLDLALQQVEQSSEYADLKPLIENIKSKLKIKK